MTDVSKHCCLKVYEALRIWYVLEVACVHRINIVRMALLWLLTAPEARSTAVCF